MLQCNILVNASTEHKNILKNINKNGNAYEYHGMLNLKTMQTKQNRKQKEKEIKVKLNDYQLLISSC